MDNIIIGFICLTIGCGLGFIMAALFSANDDDF